MPERLDAVPEPRRRRGVRHSLAGVLAIAAAAVLAGSESVLAIGEWAVEAPQVVLGALGSRRSPHTGQFTAPHGDTFLHVLRAVDADAPDMVIGLFLAERVGIGAPHADDGAQRAEDNSEVGHDLGTHSDGTELDTEAPTPAR